MEKQEMKIINVEKIMEEIRAEIKEKGYVDDLPDFSDTFCTISPSHRGIFDKDEFQETVQYLNENWNVQAYRQLIGNGLAGKIKILIRKIIRKCIKFYIEPIVEEQDKFNGKVTTSFNILVLYVTQMQEENSNLKKQIEQLEKEKPL